MARESELGAQARVAAELSVKLGIYVSPRTARAYWPPESRSLRITNLLAALGDIHPQP